MSANLFVGARFRALDANGNPLAGGLLYTYAAGTATPQATYTTPDMGVANANPVVLDANGEADVWLTPSVSYKFLLQDSAAVLQWTVDNVASPASTDASTSNAITDPGGRLSLTASTPVTTGDFTAQLTLFYLPYTSDKVPLYDGTSWALYSIGSGGLSQTTADNTKSPAAVTANSNYDVYVWNDAGTIRLSRGPAWTSDLARGVGAGTTELQRVNGRYVNKNSITNGPAAQRGLYVGTVRSDGSSQLNDSLLKRNVWNAYNRVRRHFKLQDTTSSWASGTAGTFRRANNSASNVLEMVRGLDEDAVDLSTVNILGTGAGTTAASSGIAMAGSLANLADVQNSASGPGNSVSARYTGLPGLGFYQPSWLEIFNATATANAWTGVPPLTGGVSGAGMTGHCMG